MRLFIAINFDAETRAKLLALRDELRAKSRSGNFSAPENLHLTLVFLGECDAQLLAAAKVAMDAVRFAPFSVNIERVGRFRRDGGDVWWAGLRNSHELIQLQRALSDELIRAGFALERRKYSPHITLGREVITNAAPWQPAAFGETVTGIELMKSERANEKLTYTAIYER